MPFDVFTLLKGQHFLPAAVISLLGAAAAADEAFPPAPPADESAAWCSDDLPFGPFDERFGPDGVVAGIGSYYFRICALPKERSDSPSRSYRIFFNPRRVDGLSSDRSMISTSVQPARTYDMKRSDLLGRHRRLGDIVFGGASYSVWGYDSPLHGGALSPGRSYEYAPSAERADPEVPRHFVYCNGPLPPADDQVLHCFISVEYRELVARILFINGGSIAPPMPYEELPMIARDVFLLLQAADVTDDLETLPAGIPFIE